MRYGSKDFGQSNLEDEIAINWDDDSFRKGHFGGKDQVFRFGYADFEMPIRLPSEDE